MPLDSLLKMKNMGKTEPKMLLGNSWLEPRSVALQGGHTLKAMLPCVYYLHKLRHALEHKNLETIKWVSRQHKNVQESMVVYIPNQCSATSTGAPYLGNQHCSLPRSHNRNHPPRVVQCLKLTHPRERRNVRRKLLQRTYNGMFSLPRNEGWCDLPPCLTSCVRREWTGHNWLEMP